jgi:hypothetical protein
MFACEPAKAEVMWAGGCWPWLRVPLDDVDTSPPMVLLGFERSAETVLPGRTIRGAAEATLRNREIPGQTCGWLSHWNMRQRISLFGSSYMGSCKAPVGY